MKKQIIITGGYSGIGLELSKILLKQGHKLGLIVRNENSQSDFLNKYPEFDTENTDFFIADLGIQEKVVQIANAIKEKWDKVDILFNNAGILLGEEKYSVQGNEMHFEINTLAPYSLAIELKSSMIKSKNALIVNTVTDGLHYMKKIDINGLLSPKKFRKLFGSYMHSKLALALLMNNISDEWIKDNIRIINASPGGNKTKLTKGNGMPVWMIPFRILMYKKPEYGAKLLYDAAFKEDFMDKTGVFLQNNKIQKLRIRLKNEENNELLKGLKTAHISHYSQ
ncbi:MAG TPA: SDR family NAD(P)-dependent oxidoreductase [Ignavibacteria bacterium]